MQAFATQNKDVDLAPLVKEADTWSEHFIFWMQESFARLLVRR